MKVFRFELFKTFSILKKKNKTWPGVLTENVPFRFPLFEENVKEAKLGWFVQVEICIHQILR